VRRMLELMLELRPPGRLWFIGRTPANKGQNAMNQTLRTLMLTVQLAGCLRTA
jgi:hypothetical protein